MFIFPCRLLSISLHLPCFNTFVLSSSLLFFFPYFPSPPPCFPTPPLSFLPPPFLFPEVRNPLNGIVLTLEYITTSLSHELSAAMRKEIETIKTCAGHQTLLLKSIMDLDKIMAGNKNLPREEFNPVQLCRDAVAMTVHAAKEGVAVVVDETSWANGAADSCFMGAPTQLNLVLINLLSNAAKFTTVGRVVLSAAVVTPNTKIKTQNLKQGFIKFTVTDSGPGVPEDQQKKIFGMRDQTGNDASRAKGFGVGLFVAKQLVHQMGGELQLRSPVTDHDVYKGCEFSFEVRADKNCGRPAIAVNAGAVNRLSRARPNTARMRPHTLDNSLIASPTAPSKKISAVQTAETAETAAEVAKAEAEREAEGEEEVEGGAEGGGTADAEGEGTAESKGEGEGEGEGETLAIAKGWRVLLTDDSNINLRLLKRKFASGPFKDLGWQVETTTTGEKALAMIDEASGGGGRRFNLVIFDQNMQPDGNLLGTEASRILRDKDSEILIVGLTGNCMPDDRKKSKESGQDIFWSKPAPKSEDALKELVGALVEKRRRERE